MGQTVVLRDSGRIRALDEMMSCGPWIPSQQRLVNLHSHYAALSARENSISGQRLDETHFESGDLIFPALLVLCVGTRG